MPRCAFVKYGIIIAVLILSDWGSKCYFRQLFGGEFSLIPGFVSIQVLQNKGFLFGLLADASGSHRVVVNLFIVSVASLLLMGLAWRTPLAKTHSHSGFACMIGGALANGLDRLNHGYVLDFLQIGPLGVYNLADFALLFGAALVLWDFWFSESGELGRNASDSI